MTARGDFRTLLEGLDAAASQEFLTAHSALPGPRANLELLAAFGDVAPADQILALVGSDDEYVASCAAAALGRLAGSGSAEQSRRALDLMRASAADLRWRVREGVAMGLQRLGDADPVRLCAVALAWAVAEDPLVQRAAVAGICEPRLLRDPSTARCALEACRLATASIAALGPEVRRRTGVRVLRQGLGYCWSVAVVGDPEHGLPAFDELAASDDPDVRWIVRSNRSKARLIRLLAAAPGSSARR